LFFSPLVRAAPRGGRRPEQISFFKGKKEAKTKQHDTKNWEQAILFWKIGFAIFATCFFLFFSSSSDDASFVVRPRGKNDEARRRLNECQGHHFTLACCEAFPNVSPARKTSDSKDLWTRPSSSTAASKRQTRANRD
jgi:hypothetical protein